MYQFNRKEYEERMKWYQDARFGMFIHWGLYSIPARGEWVRSTEEMPEEEYLPFMKEFDARDYDPKQWAKEAKAAGMKYVTNLQTLVSVGNVHSPRELVCTKLRP